MAQFINPKSNAVIDGIIEEFTLQSDSITAGEFVNFIDKMKVDSESTLVATSNAGDYLKAVKLSDTKVVILHRSSSTTTLSANVVTIANGTVTAATGVIVCNNDGDCTHYDAVAMDDSRILIVFARGAGSYYLNSKVISVSGNAISQGDIKQLSSVTGSGTYNKVIKVSERRVLIIHTNNNLQLKARLCDIDGTTITSLSETAINDVYSSASYFNAVALDSKRVFVAHPKAQSTSAMNGFIITINGDTLTAGTDYTLVESNYQTRDKGIELVDENKVLVTYCEKDTYHLCAVVCEVNGSNITHGNATKLATEEQSGFNVIQKLDTNKVAIFHSSDSTNYHLKCMVCAVGGLSISKHVDEQLSNVLNSGQDLASAMVGNQVLVFHSASGSVKYLGATVVSEDSYAKAMTTKDEPYGIAMNKATSGKVVRVAMPKV